MNKVILMGNLTRDVEIRHLPNGSAVGNFGLAINRRWRDSNGEQKEETTFVDCEVWSKAAENMVKHFAKGSRVLIDGRLKLDQWEDKTDGTKRSKLKVVVESFHFCDKGNGSGDGGGAPARSSNAPSRAVAQIDDDSIPF